jgi:NADH-quinone oxidoreductase subunit N
MAFNLSEVHYASVMPEIQVAVTALVIMLYDAFSPKGSGRREIGYIALTGLAMAGFSVYRLADGSAPPSSFSGMIVTDPLRLCFAAIFLLVAAVAVLLAMQMIEDEKLPGGEYFTLLMFGTTGMLLMSAAGDFATLFLGLETLSITTYVLAGFRRTDLRSNESALKYFLLGSFSTGFLLYGVALIYGATQTTNFSEIRLAVSTGNLTSHGLLTVGAALVLIGLCFKIASAPFHFWTPDVYQGAPTAVTAFMATGPKAAAFAALLRVFSETFTPSAGSLYENWTAAVSVIAILSMIIGNLVAIRQTDIKRMLAYSSIAHAGYALIGVVARDWAAVAFYMLTYVVMNLGAFGVVALLARAGDEKTGIDDYAGVGFRSLGLSLTLGAFLLSLGGVPLTAGFMGKLVIFQQAWKGGFQILVIVGAVNSAISLYYYLRPVVAMFFKERDGEYVPPRVSGSVYAALAVTLAAVLYLGVFPGKILDKLDGFAKNSDKVQSSPSARRQ